MYITLTKDIEITYIEDRIYLKYEDLHAMKTIKLIETSNQINSFNKHIDLELFEDYYTLRSTNKLNKNIIIEIYSICANNVYKALIILIEDKMYIRSLDICKNCTYQDIFAIVNRDVKLKYLKNL